MSYEVWGEPDDDYMTAEQAVDNGWLSPDSYSKGAMDVLNERVRHESEEGWTPAHDDNHTEGELARAGGCYAIAAGIQALTSKPGENVAAPPAGVWPWHPDWWKPRSARENLVRAASLLIAEIDRLDRAEAAAKTEERHGV